jgi:hypothetical protein
MFITITITITILMSSNLQQDTVCIMAPAPACTNCSGFFRFQFFTTQYTLAI